jgi:hypothetical protein
MTDPLKDTPPAFRVCGTCRHIRVFNRVCCCTAQDGSESPHKVHEVQLGQHCQWPDVDGLNRWTPLREVSDAS